MLGLACTERLTGPASTPVAPSQVLTRLDCVATTSTRQVTCTSVDPSSAKAASTTSADLIVGGQNTFVTLASTNVTYVDDVFSFNTTVKNLLGQALGTTDGTTLDPSGVRVFFEEQPVATSGSGTLDFQNPLGGSFVDGFASFTQSNQPYYQYNQLLAPDQTSTAKLWRIHVPATVGTFSFSVYVSAPVQYPTGYIVVTPATLVMKVGGATQALAAVVKDVVSRTVADAVTWSSGNTGVATVDANTGVVTPVADGVAMITATSTTRTGTAVVTVASANAANTTITGAPASLTVGNSSTITVQAKTSAGANMTIGGDAVLLNASAGTLGSVTDNHDGTYTTTLNSNAATTITITGTINAAPIGHPGTVVFTAGLPASATIQSTNPQTAAVNTAVAAAPSVLIKDANNNPVPDVTVTFAVTGGGGSVTGAAPITNASGIATAGSWILGTTVGTNNNTVSATAATGSATATFTASATPGAVHHFVVEAAGGGAIGAQLAGTPFNVKVTAQDAFNNTATSFTGTVTFSTTPPGGVTAGGTSAAFTAGVLASHAITLGTAGDVTLTATRSSGGSETGTSASFQVQQAPISVADAPTASSVPNDPYHTAFNTTFNLAAAGVMANDARGFPLATVVSFGADSLAGVVTDHAAGTPVSLPGHGTGSIVVNANGSVAFTPPTGFTGLYVIKYRISNVRGISDAQLTIAVGVRPAIGGDTYPTALLGNVPINTATSSNFNVTSNDAGDARVLAVTGATNGTVTLAQGGTFSFTPTAGYTGPASFTYTVANGFGTTAAATVSMTVSGIAWFIDRGAVAGDGRFGTPFNDLSTAFAAGTKPQANQAVFLYSNGTAYTGGVTLLAGQKLVGQGATGASFASVMGVSWPADAGAQPSIGGSQPSVGSGLTLGAGNTLQGFTLTSGTLTGTSFGTLTVGDLGITTSSQALNLTTGTLAGSFTQVRSTGGTNNVALSSVATSGTTTLGTSADALSGATGDAFKISGGNGSFTYAGSITNSAALAVNISGKTGGTVTLSGDINPAAANRGISIANNSTGTNTILFSGANQKISAGTSAGVSLSTNTGATISFTGGRLAITTTTGNGFTATGGGTVNVTGANNSISSAGGIALNVSATTIGASNLTFRSISANGGSNGIFLSGTGSSGGVTVTGDGATTGSGGTIVNMTGADNTTSGSGIYLTSTQNVNLSWMSLSGHSNHAIYGLEVTGFALAKAQITGLNGDNESVDDGAVIFDNLYGSASITGSRITGGRKDNVRIFNGLVATAAAALNRMTMTSDTIFGNIAGTNINIAAYKSAVVKATIQSSKFTASRGSTISFATNESSSGDVIIDANSISNTDPNQVSGTTGIFVGNASSGALTYQVTTNTVTGMFGSGIEVDRGAGGAGSMTGNVTGNIVGTSGVNGSGSRDGTAIFIGLVQNSTGAATHTATVANNTVRQFGNYGIKVLNSGAGGGYLNVSMTGNNVAEPSTTAPGFPTGGLRWDLGVSSGPPSHDGKTCVVMTGNTVTNAGTNGGEEIRVRGRFATKTGIPGVGADPNAFFAASNTITTAGVAVNATSTNAFQNSCPPI
ncbi:MAG: putative Ig protein [Gemmatimonadetes bacterium]|nr:putative Ig protein [Gemmatimonadota bacterium]